MEYYIVKIEDGMQDKYLNNDNEWADTLFEAHMMNLEEAGKALLKTQAVTLNAKVYVRGTIS